MNSLSIVLVLASVALALASRSPADCNFDEKRSFCRWKREWFGMRRAGWRSGQSIPNGRIEDHTTGRGKMAYFLSRSRPAGFRSRLRSPSLLPEAGSCLVFWVALGGARRSFPDGNSMLRLYVVGQHNSVDHALPLWTKEDQSLSRGNFENVVIPLDEAVHAVNSLAVQFVFEAIRGGSKKSYVVLDDVTVQPCSRTTSDVSDGDSIQDEMRMKMNDVTKNIINLMLPAQRTVDVMQFQDSVTDASYATSSGNDTMDAIRVISVQNDESSEQQASLGRPKSGKKARRGRKGRRGRNGRRRRKNRRNRNKHVTRTNDHGFGRVFLEEPVIPQQILALPSPTEPPMIMCDFIEYTLRLHRCFREFFSMLRKRPSTCVSRYETLETCLQGAATSCVPSRDMDPGRVEELVTNTMRNNFRTREVFCEEEGAFVYPEFAVAQLPIQCGARYFIKLSECSGSFSSMFHVQHGNPQLCKEYYSANECQRQTTAEECNFDTETMLLYGLSLQYQFAHNPFCIHLPFSSWWPES